MYQKEEEYGYALQAEAEAQAENDAAEAHFNYMNDLIENKEFDIYALEYCIDLLNSKKYEKQTLGAKDFLYNILEEKRNKIQENSEKKAKKLIFMNEFESFDAYFSKCPETICGYSKNNSPVEIKYAFDECIPISKVEEYVSNFIPF